MDFTIPAGSGSYAPEVYYVTHDGLVESASLGSKPLARVTEAQANIKTLTATATLEMDLLTPGGDPDTESDWSLARASWTTAGLQDPQSLSRWPGVRFRAKSGGTAGTTVVDISTW